MNRFPEIWQAACDEILPDPKGAAGELMKGLGDLLKVEQVEYAQIGNAALFLFDLSPLGFSRMDLNVVMVTHRPHDEEEAREQARLLADYKHAVESVGFCFHILLEHDLPAANPFISSYLDAVFVCGADLERLFGSDLPHAILFEIIRRQVRLLRLCPFNTTHEARGSMFRGRRTELSRLVEDLDTNYVVSGARRIGKTSLLKRAHDVLRKRQELRNRIFYFNCITWGNLWDCFDRLAHVIDPKKELRIEKNARNVSYMFERRSFRGSRPLLLFFDELDRLVDADLVIGWPFFSVLAEAAASDWIRVVFAGYRSMAWLAHGEYAKQAKSPFLGALQPIDLQPLSRTETYSLLAEPFKNVQITFRQEEAVLERVWHVTAGYPFLIQFYGEKLFHVSSNKSPQVVELADVDEVESSFDLRDFLEMHLLQNTVNHAGPCQVERLCAFLYAHQAKEPWTEQDFLEACRAHDYPISITELHDSLRSLYQAKVLSFHGSRYSFTFPLLGKVLRESYPDLSMLLNTLEKV